MDSKIETYLLVGTLGAAVLCVGGYGLYRESQRRNSQGPGGAPKVLGASPTDASDSGTGRAGLRIETLSVVSANRSGLEARVIGTPGLSFEWSIKGGKLESDNQHETIQWTAGPAGDVVLTCRAFDPAGGESTVTARIPIKPVSTISLFEAVPPVVTQGAGAKLGWTVKDCRKLVLDPGGRDVTALTGPGLEVKPTETTTYTLTATDVLGTVTTQNVTLRVVPAPQIDSLRADPKPGAADAFTVIAEFKGGKAELKNGGVLVAGGNTSPLRADLSGVKAGASLSLVVTNDAGSSVSTSVQFAVKKP